jgi:hypothetical protein
MNFELIIIIYNKISKMRSKINAFSLLFNEKKNFIIRKIKVDFAIRTYILFVLSF